MMNQPALWKITAQVQTHDDADGQGSQNQSEGGSRFFSPRRFELFFQKCFFPCFTQQTFQRRSCGGGRLGAGIREKVGKGDVRCMSQTEDPVLVRFIESAQDMNVVEGFQTLVRSSPPGDDKNLSSGL